MAQLEYIPADIPVYPAYAPQQSSSWTSFFLYALATVGIASLLAHFFGSASRPRRRVQRKGNRRSVNKRAASAAESPSGKWKGDTTDPSAEPALVHHLDSDSDSDSDPHWDEPSVRRTVGDVIGDVVTSSMVTSAILLKRSPIPDLLASFTSYSLEGYKRVNNAFQVEDLMVKASQRAVSASITATGILAHATIKAGLAYQSTPGRREAHRASILHDTPDNVVDQDREVKILRIRETLLPGSIPHAIQYDVSTQTDISGMDIAQPSTPTTYQTVINTPLSLFGTAFKVAGNVATAGSELIIGKDRTLMLLGVDPLEVRRLHVEPEDGNVMYLSVGGVLYATTLETVTAAKDSLLAEWFGDASKRATLEVRDGNYFVDRDGTHFRHVLNYLRDIPTHHTIDHIPSLRQLHIEAVYYRLPELAEEVLEKKLYKEANEQSALQIAIRLANARVVGETTVKVLLAWGLICSTIVFAFMRSKSS
ncbi:hypothetical protein DFS34DRAFT_620742 [Phlyctochytrium arcticum]|nr:hypothetical protein DFS34DRAFT_620742 [Phlyctochytrium arcticum]